MANILESLGSIAPQLPSASLRGVTAAEHLRAGRTCYDHLAGRLGVSVTEALVHRGAIAPDDSGFGLTRNGAAIFDSLGIDVADARRKRRAFSPGCLDWTERRLHLAGALGATLTTSFVERSWIRHRRGSRAVSITPVGERELRRRLALALD